MGVRTERWLVKPLSCPRPIRYCPDCGIAREFVCSERFRVNAQKKVVDVWLKYRCAECGNVWKYPVMERQRVAALDPELHDAFSRHDSATVWKYAFDLGRLRSHAMHITADGAVAVERTSIASDATDSNSSALVIHFAVPFACDMRLDRLLASELRMSRAMIARWLEDQKIHIQPDSKAMGRPVRTGLRVLIEGIDAVSSPEGTLSVGAPDAGGALSTPAPNSPSHSADR